MDRDTSPLPVREAALALLTDAFKNHPVSDRNWSMLPSPNQHRRAILEFVEARACVSGWVVNRRGGASRDLSDAGLPHEVAEELLAALSMLE